MSLADRLRWLFGRTGPPSATGAEPARSHDETVTRWQKALADFGYPHTIVSAGQAEAALRAEDELGPQQGFTPVIIVPGYWNSTRMTPQRRMKKVRHLLEGHAAVHDAAYGRALLQGMFDGLYDDRELDPGCLDPALFDALQPVASQTPEPGFTLLRRLNLATRVMEPVPQAAIVRIPTTDSHTIPLYLDWGGWNAVPSPLEICAISRCWGETWGARLTAIGSDQLEFTVARKPVDHGAAVALLKEHYCFAPDHWEQDRRMLQEAASLLRVSDTWVFWWD